MSPTDPNTSGTPPETASLDDSANPLGFSAIARSMKPVGAGTSDNTAPAFQASLPISWRQGRTAYGGITAGLSLVAAQQPHPSLPSSLPMLRSASVSFIGPVTGDPVFRPTLIRQGRNVTSAFVTGAVEDAPISNATLFFGTTRESHLTHNPAGPKPPPPDECEPFTKPEAENAVPAFFSRFETKIIDGFRPFDQADEGYIKCWSRHADPGSREGMASFLTLADVLPPAAMPLFRKMGPISTVNWMINILQTPQTEDGWYQVESRMTAAQDGYSSQIMRYWNSDNRLIAEAIQSVAIFV